MTNCSCCSCHSQGKRRPSRTKPQKPSPTSSKKQTPTSANQSKKTTAATSNDKANKTPSGRDGKRGSPARSSGSSRKNEDERPRDRQLIINRSYLLDIGTPDDLVSKYLRKISDSRGKYTLEHAEDELRRKKIIGDLEEESS